MDPPSAKKFNMGNPIGKWFFTCPDFGCPVWCPVLTDKHSEHYSSERGMSPPGKTSGGHEISGTDEMGALPARARLRKIPDF